MALGPIPAGVRERQQWRRRALVVAAYRDRYQITDTTPLGAQPKGTAQKIDRARAETALRMLPRGRVENPQTGPERRMERPLQLWPNSL